MLGDGERRRVLSLRSSQYGVSLVELMIGLAVAAILLAMGAPSFSTYIQNTHIRNAAEAIQNGLNLARAEAVRRNTNVQFVLGDDSSWTVGCETALDDEDADDAADCPASISAKPAAEGSAKASIATSEVVALSKAVIATPNNKLVFNGVGKATTLPAANMAVFDVSNPAAGACLTADGRGKMRCLRVTVTAGGQVRMCDPIAPNDSAQVCS